MTELLGAALRAEWERLEASQTEMGLLHGNEYRALAERLLAALEAGPSQNAPRIGTPEEQAQFWRDFNEKALPELRKHGMGIVSLGEAGPPPREPKKVIDWERLAHMCWQFYVHRQHHRAEGCVTCDDHVETLRTELGERGESLPPKYTLAEIEQAGERFNVASAECTLPDGHEGHCNGMSPIDNDNDCDP